MIHLQDSVRLLKVFIDSIIKTYQKASEIGARLSKQNISSIFKKGEIMYGVGGGGWAQVFFYQDYIK